MLVVRERIPNYHLFVYQLTAAVGGGGRRRGCKEYPPSQEVETKSKASRQRKNHKLSSVCVSADGSLGGGGHRVSPTSQGVETKAEASLQRKNPKLTSVCVSADGSWWGGRSGSGGKEYPSFTGGRDQGGS